MTMRATGVTLCVGMAILLAAGTPSAADGPALVQVGRTDTPPVIDGNLDDPSWENAAVITPFLLNDGSGLATQQTVGRLLWDDHALYLAFECRERSLEPMTQQVHLLQQKVTEHGGHVFSDESIEVFLQPGGTGHYYQLAANILGFRYEAIGMDPAFSAQWEAAATTGTDAWRLEVAIPFASLGVRTPQPGDRWGFNVCRNQWPRDERSTWSGLRGAFHAPEAFGELVFAAETVAVQPADLQDLSAAATALRLRLGDVTVGAEAEVQVQADTLRRARTQVAPGATEVSVRYPLGLTQTAPVVRYLVTQVGGPALYRSPWFPQAAAAVTLTGSLTLRGGAGVLRHNGEVVAELADGESLALERTLAPGLNALAVEGAGGATLEGSLAVGDQTLPFGRGWRGSPRAAEGWDAPDFDVRDWEPLVADGEAVRLPEGDQTAIRRTIAVSDRRERFWPLQPDLHLPADSRMFVKPLFSWVGDAPTDYVYVLDLPDPILLVSSDNLDGVPLKPWTGERIMRDDHPYTRYRLSPVGTLTGGFTLELLWKNEAGTSSEYVSALSFGGTFDWRDFEVELTSPPYAELVGVLPLKWQNRGIHGTCWYDDIELIDAATGENLLPQGDFEGPEWDGKPHMAMYERDGAPNRAVRLSGTEEQVNRQAGLWVSGPTIEVRPSTRYILRVRAKGENIVARQEVGRACLVADVGNPDWTRLMAYSHYEALDGNVVEAERASPIHILPAMKRRAPQQVPIIACYHGFAYENPDVIRANAEMVLDAGINWLWGSNQSATAELLKPHGMKFVWHIPRTGFDQAPVDREYLTRHPDHAALQRNGAPSPSQICPTILLDHDNEFIPAMQEWFAERIRENPYDMIDWDHEFPVTYDNSVCLCARCRTAFAQEYELEATPTLEEVFEQHEKEWIAFRCGQNVRMAVIIRDACKAANPDIPFSVYSGFQTERTQWLYGVDWSRMREAIDWAIAGYNGTREVIQTTIRALDGVPFTTGCMYVEKRFTAEYPYPTPESWRIRLMRAVLDCEGMGFLIWYLPVLDGAGYWGIGWVAAMVADFEGFFTDFQRNDALAVAEPVQDANHLAVLTRGDERLIIVMNPSNAGREVELTLQEVPAGATLTEYETDRMLDPSGTLRLDLPAGDIRVLHMRAR